MSLTNRPEFMSQSMPRGPMKRPKPREHEQDIPIEGARLIVKNLEFSVGADDLEELFRDIGFLLDFYKTKTSFFENQK